MRNAINMTSRRFGKTIIGFAVLLNIFAATGLAQNVKNTDNSPDKALKSNARINPSTLAMELSIPLIGYAGRAGNGMPASISYSSKVWGMQNYGSQWFNNIEMLVNDVRPQFAKNSAAGWSSSLGTVRLDFSWDPYHAAYSNPQPPYGLRPETEGQIYSPATVEPDEDNDLFYVKRVQVLMPDGSSHEFRSSDTPIFCGTIVGGGCSGTDFTGTYLSVDGSRMRLEVGSETRVLYLPNGSRYLFGTPNLAHTFFDVHGNKMTYDTTDREWTDTLGRVIEDPMPSNWNGTQNQTVQNDTVTFPGFNSGNYNVVFSWLELEDALLNPSDDLRFIGSKSCNGSSHTNISPYLFYDGGEHSTRLCNLGTEFNPVVLSKVTLPNGQFYEFKYNVFGEITKVIYPSGAYERFVYSRITSLSPGNYAYGEANRGVTERYVSEKGDGTDEIEWNYAAPGGTGLNPYYVTTTAPDGSYSQQYIYMDGATIPSKPFGFSNAYAGRAYDERSYDSNDVLRVRKLTTWEETGPLSGGHSAARRDMRPTKEVSMIFEPGDSNALATMTETVYDTTGNSDAAYFSALNPKQQKTYHYVVVNASTAATANIATAAGWFSAATPATVTEMDYLYDANYKARNITGLVTETRVEDASGNVKAKSQVTYDGLSLLDESESTRWENPSSNYRGLVTKTRSWHDIANNLYIDTQAQYDMMGNLRYSWDGRGNLSQVEYSSTYDYAFPTKTISPIPDSSGTYGFNDELETTTAYDYNTGLPTSSLDANGLETRMEYVDSLLRPTTVSTWHNNVQVGSETVTEYGAGTSPSTRWVKSRSQIDATNWKEAISWFDGLGRDYLSQSIDDELDDVFAVTCYDNMGRVSKSSNPVRASSAPTCSSSLEWTTPGYDLIGRTITITTPDSSVVETAYSLATSGSQIGTVVTVEDQAGKLRRSVTNALGQLKRVDEPTTSGLGTISSPNQDTVYAYDLLNNLITVSQGAQTRSFTYDALSRLKSATNPESGTINYTFDANGNLATKIDARTITTTYTYDRLNRVTLRNYSDSTPDVTMYYDNLTNGKGKLKKVTSSISTTEYTGYDILGRVTAHKQTTDSVDYTTGYTFDLAGNLLEQTYPGGRVVKNTLDSDGSLSQVQSKKSGATYLNYANGFNYNAAGAVTSMKLGNGLWETTQFNSRLQPTQIGLGVGSATPNKLKLAYSYGTTANNGNVMSQTITVPGVAHPFIQTYAYDELNRISNAEETSNSVQTWEQAFTYDRYGNRNFDEANTTTLVKNCGSSPNFTVCAADRKIVNPGFETNNRLETDDDYVFDNAGNTTEDAMGRTFVYDAENKQIEVIDNSVTVGEYSYDGDGKRIKKHVPATGELTVFIYDAAGKLIQEHSTIVQTGGNAKTVYTTNDHLGSPRINTDATGQVISRHDYHPFGDEVTRSGYGSDTIRKQFTGYERDTETSLDFAQARMFSSSLGRFTVPDPAMVSASLQNPQTWNRYPYVLNNPLKYSDPLGLWVINRVVHMKKDKNGKETDKVDYVELLLEAEEGDDVNTLKEQFNLKKDKDATKLMGNLKENGMRLSKVDNYAISTVFGEIEKIEKDYEQDIRDKGGKEAANKNGADCSMTTARLSFRDTSRTMTTDELKAYAESLPNSNRKPEEAKTGDAVLWMNGSRPEHFATFLMKNKSGEPVVYSKTGSTGPYERKTTSDISTERPHFGKVTNYYVGRP